MRRPLGLILAAALLLTAAAATAAPAPPSMQQQTPADPLDVVESFLAARNAQDPSGATDWCASLLELQDMGGHGFVDASTMRAWLRRLSQHYRVDALSTPLVVGGTVMWTELLTPRNPPSGDALVSSTTVDVHAVVRDGKITSLSASYPRIRGAPTVEVDAG